jgi:hypothetical protein
VIDMPRMDVNLGGIEQYLIAEHQVRMAQTRMLVSYLSRRIMERARPRTPVQTGELVSSLTSEPMRLRRGTGRRIVYRAKHALKVHEEPQYMRATGESHFLTKSEDEGMDIDFPQLREELFNK